MAHVGKSYPFGMRRDLCVLQINGYVAPRKFWWHSSSAFSIGSLAAPWLGQDIDSSLGVEESGGDVVRYQIDHPTVADNFIAVKWTVEERPGPVTDTPKLQVKIVSEFWYSGTKYGDHTTIRFGEVFLGSPPLCDQWSAWSNIINSSMFHSIGVGFLRACTWARQPDYHPYRYIS